MIEIAKKIYNTVETINNPTRKKILEFITKKPRSITEIQKHIGISYRNIHLHIKKLENIGVIIKTPRITDKAKEMIISIKPNSVEGIVKGWKSQFDKAYEKDYKRIIEVGKE